MLIYNHPRRKGAEAQARPAPAAADRGARQGLRSARLQGGPPAAPDTATQARRPRPAAHSGLPSGPRPPGASLRPRRPTRDAHGPRAPLGRDTLLVGDSPTVAGPGQGSHGRLLLPLPPPGARVRPGDPAHRHPCTHVPAHPCPSGARAPTPPGLGVPAPRRPPRRPEAALGTENPTDASYLPPNGKKSGRGRGRVNKGRPTLAGPGGSQGFHLNYRLWDTLWEEQPSDGRCRACRSLPSSELPTGLREGGRVKGDREPGARLQAPARLRASELSRTGERPWGSSPPGPGRSDK